MGVQYMRIESEHSQKSKNKGLIADSRLPEKKRSGSSSNNASTYESLFNDDIVR